MCLMKFFEKLTTIDTRRAKYRQFHCERNCPTPRSCQSRGRSPILKGALNLLPIRILHRPTPHHLQRPPIPIFQKLNSPSRPLTRSQQDIPPLFVRLLPNFCSHALSQIINRLHTGYLAPYQGTPSRVRHVRQDDPVGVWHKNRPVGNYLH